LPFVVLLHQHGAHEANGFGVPRRLLEPGRARRIRAHDEAFGGFDGERPSLGAKKTRLFARYSTLQHSYPTGALYIPSGLRADRFCEFREEIEQHQAGDEWIERAAER
jgi:hypothetical protein